MEKPAVVAAPDKDANHLFLSVKSGPGRDTMTPIKEPCTGLVQYRRPALSFLAKLAHPEGSRDGPALRSRIRLAFFPPGPAAVYLFC